MVKKTLMLMALVLAVGLAIGFYKTRKGSVWDGQTRISLAVVSPSVMVASFDPLEQSLVFLTFPPQAHMEAVGGYGNYLIDSIYPLGEMEGKGKGGTLLAKSLQENLGLVIDGHLVASGIQETKASFLGKILDLLKNQEETNLNRGDILRLWWAARNIKEDRVWPVKLEEPLEPERLERTMGQYFGDEKIREEALTIAVLNATGQPGLATKEARIIKNMGGRIVGLGDIENEKCQITSPQKYKNSHTARRLVKIFGCPWSGENLFGQRADLVLVLGEMI